MNVGPGHWVFAAIFFLLFIACMIWAYRKDRFTDKYHFKGSYKLIFFVLIVLGLVFLFVKLKTS